MKVFIWLALILLFNAVTIYSAAIDNRDHSKEEEIEPIDNEGVEIQESKNEENEAEVEVTKEASQETGCSLKDRIVAFFTNKGKGKAKVDVSHEDGSTEFKAEVGKRWESEDGKTKVEANVHVNGKFNGGDVSTNPSNSNYGASLHVETEW